MTRYRQFEEFEQPGPEPKPFLKPAVDHAMGVDLAADGTDTTVAGHWEGGVFHVDHVGRDQVKEALARMTTKELHETFERSVERELYRAREEMMGVRGVRVFYDHEDVTDQVLYPDSGIIEGTAVRVEKDPARLIDAGEPES